MFGELLAPQYLRWLLDGFLLTLGLALLSCLLATLIGAPLAIARLSRRRLLSWPARAYLALFRNTPLLVQLFFWYFGVPALLPEALVSWLNTPHETPLLDWPSFEFLAGAWGLTLYTSAFVAEEFRAGIASVRPEQRAAGLALGLTQRQVGARRPGQQAPARQPGDGQGGADQGGEQATEQGKTEGQQEAVEQPAQVLRGEKFAEHVRDSVG